jgi:hypothetical protein
MMDRNLKGRRVRLINCSDPWTSLPPGLLGTVTFTDDAGTLHVRWDNGSTLGLVPGEDSWVILPSEEDSQ